LRQLLDAILPARCPVCNTHLTGEVGVCQDCLDALQPIIEGQMVYLGRYRGRLERLARALKFANHRAVAGPVGARLADGVRGSGWRLDAVVPVPLHWVRGLERGYNQSRELASGIANALEVPVLDALERTRSTKRQARLEKLERAGNVRDAFQVVTEVKGLELLLVDDVHTSGATITEASLALVAASAKRVRVAVIAKALNLEPRDTKSPS
jgi:ComF family protein